VRKIETQLLFRQEKKAGQFRRQAFEKPARREGTRCRAKVCLATEWLGVWLALIPAFAPKLRPGKLTFSPGEKEQKDAALPVPENGPKKGWTPSPSPC
jgi:hypothetical protein